MARRKSKRKNKDSEDFAAGIAVIVLPFVGLFFDGTRPIAIIVLLAIAAFFAIMFLWAGSIGKQAQSDLASATAKTERVVSEHLVTLANRRDALLRVDHYGVVEGKSWNKEVQHFIDKVVLPTLSEKEREVIVAGGINQFFQPLIEDRLSEFCASRTIADEIPLGTTPVEFEGMCAQVLRECGWQASTTSGSGDQGADVIGTREGIKFVLQCKLYSGAVGNKAVQEVIAAKSFYRANIAAVVTNAQFTPSAHQLANSSGIELVHFSDLRRVVESK